MRPKDLQIQLVERSEKDDTWTYQVLAPHTHHIWRVLVSRHGSGFDRLLAESYGWQCRWDHMQGGSHITQDRHASQEVALQAAVSWIIGQEEALQNTSPSAPSA